MDYNIYIHDKTSGQSKPTQARQGGNSNTIPYNSRKEAADQATAQSAANMGEAASASKAGAVAFAIYAAVKIAKTTVDIITPFVSKETGDYRFSVAYNNVKQTISNFKSMITNPVGLTSSIASYYQDTMLYNQRQEQQRLLIGDSYINSVSRKV